MQVAYNKAVKTNLRWLCRKLVITTPALLETWVSW